MIGTLSLSRLEPQPQTEQVAAYCDKLLEAERARDEHQRRIAELEERVEEERCASRMPIDLLPWKWLRRWRLCCLPFFASLCCLPFFVWGNGTQLASPARAAVTLYKHGCREGKRRSAVGR